MSKGGQNKTSETWCPGSQMKKELQVGGSDHLCQKSQTVESNEDQEVAIGLSNLQVTGNLDSNSFREWWIPKPAVVSLNKNGRRRSINNEYRQHLKRGS